MAAHSDLLSAAVALWRRYLNVFRALLSAHALFRGGALRPFPLADTTSAGTVATALPAINALGGAEATAKPTVASTGQLELEYLPPLSLPGLLLRCSEAGGGGEVDDTEVAVSLTPLAREILEGWMSPAALASGLPVGLLTQVEVVVQLFVSLPGCWG
jgi:hypothetical protein